MLRIRLEIVERVQHVNRIKGLLFSQGVSGYEPLRRDRRQRLGELKTGAGRPLPPGEVRERVGGELAYTTVVTILSRLYAKGVLQRRKAGRAYVYAPVADEPGLAARRMARVLDGEADREAVLARFVSGLSGTDEELLRRMLGDPPGPEGG